MASVEALFSTDKSTTTPVEYVAKRLERVYPARVQAHWNLG